MSLNFFKFFFQVQCVQKVNQGLFKILTASFSGLQTRTNNMWSSSQSIGLALWNIKKKSATKFRSSHLKSLPARKANTSQSRKSKQYSIPMALTLTLLLSIMFHFFDISVNINSGIQTVLVTVVASSPLYNAITFQQAFCNFPKLPRISFTFFNL